jgi:hypothetical protein
MARWCPYKSKRYVRTMSDEQMIEIYLKKKEPTPCPVMTAHGIEDNVYRNPIPVHDPAYVPRELDSGLRRIARAKVGMALLMLGQYGQGANINQERYQARRWILDGGEDFKLWCMEAGLQPKQVQKRAREIIAGGHTKLFLQKNRPKRDSYPHVSVSILLKRKHVPLHV